MSKMLNRLTRKYQGPKMILAILLIAYCVIDIQLPAPAARFMASLPGIALMVCLVVAVFMYEDPVLGILTLLAGFITVQRVGHPAGGALGSFGASVIHTPNKLQSGLPDMFPNSDSLGPHNQFPRTLEQDVVKRMVPMVRNDSPPHLNFKPAMTNDRQAAAVGMGA